MRQGRGLALGGLALAVLAESSSIGLLGLSGWFVTACALAGAAVFSGFSYVAPSGGVRAFALTRIAGNYGSRVVLHTAALRRVAAARARLFASAARGTSLDVWSGELLDRSLTDADADGMQLIRSTAPVAVTAATAVGGVAVLGLTVSAVTAAVLALGVTVMALLARGTPRTATAESDAARAALRVEVVTGVGAWAELASLGAVGPLAARTRARARVLTAACAAIEGRRARFTLATRILAAATLGGTVAAALGAGAGAPALTLAALIAAGVLTNAEQLPLAASARAEALAARDRLRLAAGAAGARPTSGMRVTLTDRALQLEGYELPERPLRPARTVAARVPRGDVLLITGRSGSGKSTLLRAIAEALRISGTAADGRPLATVVAAEDYVFTGALGDNFRLADPTLADCDVDRRLAEFWLDRNELDAASIVGSGRRALSGGERRRICIARAMATRPHVLLVDEPITGLDEGTGRHVLRLLADRSDTTTVLTLHAAPPTLAERGNVTVIALDE